MDKIITKTFQRYCPFCGDPMNRFCHGGARFWECPCCDYISEDEKGVEKKSG